MYTIAQVISSGGFYGAEQIALQLSISLKNKNYDTLNIVIDSPGAQQFKDKAASKNQETIIIPANKNILAIKKNLRNIILDRKIDIVHSHGYKSNILCFLATINTSTKKIATCHAWISDSLKLKLYEFIDKKILRYFDYVVVVSQALFDDVSNSGLNNNRLALFKNGVDFPPKDVSFDPFKVRQELNIPKHVKVVLRVGRLVQCKGNDCLLTSFKQLVKHQDAILVFVGDGDEKEKLIRQARELDIEDKIVFTGYRNDIPELLYMANVFVISSYSEAMPIVLIEAMAAKIPIVTTAVGDIPNAVENGVSAWVIPPHNACELKKALVSALGDNEAVTRKTDLAYRHYLKYFSGEALVRSYIKSYDLVLNE